MECGKDDTIKGEELSAYLSGGEICMSAYLIVGEICIIVLYDAQMFVPCRNCQACERINLTEMPDGHPMVGLLHHIGLAEEHIGDEKLGNE
ncbi:MAG: hypothetical protein Q9169_006274 [Polycauliona sp. 2 TL-2023]